MSKSVIHSILVGILALFCSITNLYGQFIPQETTNESADTPVQFAGDIYISIGKTMTYTGVGLILVSYIHRYTLPNNSQDQVSSLIGLASAIVGAPLWLTGIHREKYPQGVQYSGNPKGLSFRADLIGISPSVIGADIAAGYHFNPYWYLGIGAGLHQWPGQEKFRFLYYLEGRATLSNKRISPYIGARASLHYAGMDFGVRIRNKYKDAGKGDWWIGGFIDYTPADAHSGLKVGYSF